MTFVSLGQKAIAASLGQSLDEFTTEASESAVDFGRYPNFEMSPPDLSAPELLVEFSALGSSQLLQVSGMSAQETVSYGLLSLEQKTFSPKGFTHFVETPSNQSPDKASPAPTASLASETTTTLPAPSIQPTIQLSKPGLDKIQSSSSLNLAKANLAKRFRAVQPLTPQLNTQAISEAKLAQAVPTNASETSNPIEVSSPDLSKRNSAKVVSSLTNPTANPANSALVDLFNTPAIAQVATAQATPANIPELSSSALGLPSLAKGNSAKAMDSLGDAAANPGANPTANSPLVNLFNTPTIAQTATAQATPINVAKPDSDAASSPTLSKENSAKVIGSLGETATNPTASPRANSSLVNLFTTKPSEVNPTAANLPEISAADIDSSEVNADSVNNSNLPNFDTPEVLAVPDIPSEVSETASPEATPPNPASRLPGNRLNRRSVAQRPLIAEPEGIELPDLNPPTDPFPPIPPNGTLETDPPEITRPSANPLYFPTGSEQVEVQETVPITLEQSLDLGRRNNENIKVFDLQVEQALASLRQQQADLFPFLSFTSSLTRTESALTTLTSRASNRRTESTRRQLELLGSEVNESPTFSLSRSTPFGTTAFDNTLQLGYDFGIDGRRGARIRAAEGQLESAQLELEQQVEQLRFDITENYYNLQEADAEVDIQRAAVRNAQRSLEDAEALERAGVGTRFEVLQARVTLASNQQNLTNAISLQRTRRRELATTLNISQNVNLVAADSIALAGAWDMTLEDTIVMAYKNRAELEQELVNRNVAEAQRQDALGQQRPNLTATAQYNVLGQISDDASPFATQGWADGYALQVQLTWNFFDGGAARALGRQQELEIAIAEERFSQLRNQVRLEVESSFYDLQANFENIGVADLGVEEAEEALRLARLRFQAGVGTQLDVINQETDLTRAQNQLLQAIIGYNRALSSLQRAVSNLPDNNLQGVP
ncbi:MAG: TolC family protein [Microcoleaceae cyanobacterium]